VPAGANAEAVAGPALRHYSDTNVSPRYAKVAERSLVAPVLKLFDYRPAGETAKSVEVG